MHSNFENVALITIDALRADHLSCYDYIRSTSPNIDAFAEEYVKFENCYSASSFTREAVPSIITGHYPSDATGPDYSLTAPTIASKLQDFRVKSGAFHSNPYVSRAYGFANGFDEFHDDLYLSNNKLLTLAQRALDKIRNRHYVRAEEINERSLRWIDSLDNESFFLWNHYMDTHGPYEPPAQYRKNFSEEYLSNRETQKLYRRAAVTDSDNITPRERQLLIDYYDGEISYTDKQIQDFLDALQERGLLESTLIIITADHGDAFGENGYYGHPRFLHDELVHVPLIMNVPNHTSNVSIPTTTLDVFPTILSVLGQEDTNLPGNSLFNILDDPARFSDRIVYQSARGYSKKGDGELRRFAARNSDHCCFMTRNITSGSVSELNTSKSNSIIERSLRNHSDQKISTSQAATSNSESELINERLEALGYK